MTIVGGENDSDRAGRLALDPVLQQRLAGRRATSSSNNASHIFGNNSPNALLSRALVTTFKVGLNGDQRFAPFRCSYPSGTSDFRSNSC